jgi:D-3-phosphoglycerate dehydrogenase
MCVARKIPEIIPQTGKGYWEYAYTKPVYNFRDKILGIVGLGKIGRTIVPKARGFGMRIAAYDPYVDDDIFQLLDVDRKYDLPDLLGEADYITIHAPLTPETRLMIDAGALALMKKDAILVNTARGDIVDEAALAEALHEGALGGAGIDVLSTEPPDPSNPLLSAPNTVVTPHLAWYSEESFVRDMVQGMDEAQRVLSGRRPRHIVNPEIFGRRGD